MEFNVPKNIEIEDKVVGPLTIKQFMYCGIGAAILFALWFIVELWTFVFLAIPVVIVTSIIAFKKVNGRPFLTYLGTVINYFLKPKLYIWKKKNGNN